MSDIDVLLLEDKSPNLPLSALCHNTAIYENMDLLNSVQNRRVLTMEREDALATISSINYTLGRNLVFRPESLVLDGMDRGAVPNENIVRNENAGDAVGEEIAYTNAGHSLSLNNGQDGLFTIDDFLDRPIEIATGTIGINNSGYGAYPIWDIVTKAPSVRAKLKNYAFLRADIVVRVAFSASPFHSGRVLLSYQPHAGKNANIIAHLANVAVDTTYRPLFINYLSQAPGSKIVDVRSNMPVEMRCPYISPKPMGRIYNASSSALAAATSFTDFADMGTLYMYSVNPVRTTSANTSTPVGFQIFAWLENVELAVPTATQLAITTESLRVDMSKDEREVGPVETMSSSLIDLTEAAAMVPQLSLYAYPAKIIFSGMKALAAHFGWSRPHIVSEPRYVKHRPFANSSNCIGSETVELLAYDPKRELAIDGYPCGSSQDDMSIMAIASRETYIETVTWADTDVAYAAIKEYVVHPQLNTYYSDVGATPCTMVQPSAMSYAVTPFTYWRGDIIFRFDFVTSQYHRGKFAIWYEPNHHHDVLINASLALNKNDLQIVDISTTNSVELCVKWASPYPWLQTFDVTSVKNYQNGGAALVSLTAFVNGYIVMAPFVPLQSPDSSDIPINVSVRCENLLVQELNTKLPTSRFYITPQSKHVGTSSEEVTCFELNPSTASKKDITKHYFGEQPLSFRALLKRYQTVTTVSYTSSGAHEYVRFIQPIYPLIDNTYNIAAALVSPVIPHLYGYLRYAFLGVRGGIRSRMRVIEPAAPSNQSMTIAALQPISTNSAPSTSEVNSGYFLNIHGGVQFSPSTSGIAEVELPFYTMNNFVFSFADDLMGTAVEGEMSKTWTKDFVLANERRGAASALYYYVRDFAIAEDFSLMRFQGAPYYTY